MQRLFTLIFGKSPQRVVGYEDVVWRALWLATLIVFVSYASFLYFGSLYAAITTPTQDVKMVHVWKPPDQHQIHGYITVPSPCHDISVFNKTISDAEYEIAISTWHEPSRNCAAQPIRRQFDSVIFSNNKFITLRASLDGDELPVTIEKD